MYALRAHVNQVADCLTDFRRGGIPAAGSDLRGRFLLRQADQRRSELFADLRHLRLSSCIGLSGVTDAIHTGYIGLIKSLSSKHFPRQLELSGLVITTARQRSCTALDSPAQRNLCSSQQLSDRSWKRCDVSTGPWCGASGGVACRFRDKTSMTAI